MLREQAQAQITLFWARRDNIRTDGVEDVGTGGKETLSVSGTKQVETGAQTHMHASNIRREGGHDFNFKVS